MHKEQPTESDLHKLLNKDSIRITEALRPFGSMTTHLTDLSKVVKIIQAMEDEELLSFITQLQFDGQALRRLVT